MSAAAPRTAVFSHEGLARRSLALGTTGSGPGSTGSGSGGSNVAGASGNGRVTIPSISGFADIGGLPPLNTDLTATRQGFRRSGFTRSLSRVSKWVSKGRYGLAGVGADEGLAPFRRRSAGCGRGRRRAGDMVRPGRVCDRVRLREPARPRPGDVREGRLHCRYGVVVTAHPV